MIGKKFGMLYVIEETKERDSNGCKIYLCKCDCGNIVKANGSKLRIGRKRSCGCLMKKHQKEQFYKHGHTGERMFNIWRKIKQRCNDKNNKSYKDYGARGIKMCSEWENDFKSFYNWSIKNGYQDNLTIDRIDTNGNYEPSNCRWATKLQQNNNKRNNCYVTYKGETHTISEWAKILNVSDKLLYSRINKLNWSIERAFNEKPVLGKNQYTKNRI